eukprot:3954155-Prymnesium_polylepis.1
MVGTLLQHLQRRLDDAAVARRVEGDDRAAHTRHVRHAAQEERLDKQQLHQPSGRDTCGIGVPLLQLQQPHHRVVPRDEIATPVVALALTPPCVSGTVPPSSGDGS